MEIEIPYKPRDYFNEFHETLKRWIIIVAHRRSGKTTAALNHLQRSALQISHSRFAYIGPTYGMAKDIAWEMIKYYARPIPGIKFNEVELTVIYPNNSRLTLYSADNPERLRGRGFWGVVFDEPCQQPPNIFTEIIRPTLADHNGYAIWIGTPKGHNEFYRFFQKAKESEDWYNLLLTVQDTKILSEKELTDARKQMSEDEFNQEFMCSFEAALKGAYYSQELAKAREEKRIKLIPYERELKVHTAWDLGIGEAMAIGFFQRVRNEIRMIDYWQGIGDEDLVVAIKAVKNKPYIYGIHFAPHDIKVKELGSGKSRLETAEGLGIKFEIVPEMSVDDGIDAAKRMFNRLWIDEKNCQLFLDYIGQYRREWQEKKGIFKDKPLHDFTSHAADVLRYAAIVENKMVNVDFSREDFLRVQRIREQRKKHELL